MSGLEGDRLEGFPHPRETARLFGHAAQERTLLDAINSGRLHHAWLLCGPEGIGKATFAYRLTKRLMAGLRPGETLATLDLAPDNPAARQVMVQSHPDLAIVRRGFQKDGKTLSRTIAVENVRRATDLFATTSATGGWRICIVDCADEMNPSAANALLKMLEEPPPRGLFLLIAHRPGRLLPTIRSRCRRLDFAPLAVAEVEAAMRLAGGQGTEAEMAEAARLGAGSVRAALQRLEPETLALIAQVRGELSRLPGVDLARILALAENFAGRAGEEELALALETIEAWVTGEIRAQAGHGAGALTALVDAWEAGRNAIGEALTLNLDRRPAVIALFQGLAAAQAGARA